MVLSQLEAYGLTLAIEGVAAFVIAPRFGVSGVRAAAAAILGSAWAIRCSGARSDWFYGALGRLTVPALEGVVVAAEALLYRAIATRSWGRAFALSLLANLASYLIGLVLTDWL
ncbi:MAG: hypothetical protein U1E87_06110 [Alphaproteobacteria bacterium]